MDQAITKITATIYLLTNHGTSRHDVRRVFHTDGKCLDGFKVSLGFTSLAVKREQIMGNNSRIHSSRKEESIVNVGHHALVDSLGKGSPNLIVGDNVFMVLPRSIVVLMK